MNEGDYKNEVLDQFRKANSRAGHIIFMRTFRFGIMRELNPEEQRQFIDAVNEMITDGLVTYEKSDGGMDLLRLTEQGYEQLYQQRSDAQIASIILAKFKAANIKIGQIIPMRTVSFGILPSLNPKEQDRFSDVANKLIAERFITYNDGSDGRISGLTLEKRGYDYIYGVNQEQLESLF